LSRRRKKEKLEELKLLHNVFSPSDTSGQNPEELKGHWGGKVFGNTNPIVLELGCGHGYYTVGLARRFPDKNFIGIDVKGARLWKGAKTSLTEELKNTAFVHSLIEEITDYFASSEVSEIWVTFPDPYPQPAKEQKRLVSRRFLDLYKQFLQKNGIIHLKTDNDKLYEWAISFLGSQADIEVLVSTDNLYNSAFADELTSIKTHYEEIFLKEGKKIKYVKFRLRAE